jgi:6-phosphogluconate dehydrogenase
MGENLALNVERNGFPISVYNRTPEKTDAFMAQRAQGKMSTPPIQLKILSNLWNAPRKILIMVKAWCASGCGD